MQSTLDSRSTAPRHVAIIMDGNGRWATRRGLPRMAGHRAGATVVRRIVETAPELGIRVLTLFAFSADNWRRPRAEVDALMRLLRMKLESQARRCIASGMRLSVIGRRDRLPRAIVDAIEHVERATQDGRKLHVRIALDYSAREAIAAAALRWAATASRAPDALARTIADAAGDVDLLVRTGGEQRLSDFLLWECAYAELYFTARMWPDFTAHDLAAAVATFGRRERRFGALPAAHAGGAR